MAQVIICLLMLETKELGVPSLGWEDPLEEEVATHSSILVWEIPCTEESRRLQSMGSHRGALRATAQGVAKSWT